MYVNFYVCMYICMYVCINVCIPIFLDEGGQPFDRTVEGVQHDLCECADLRCAIPETFIHTYKQYIHTFQD